MSMAMRLQQWRWPRRWGWPGLAAAALALLSAVLALGAAPQWRAQAEAADRDAARSARSAAEQPDAAQRDDTLLRSLPARGSAPQRLADLLALAELHGVTVARSEQRLAREPGLPVERLQVSMPVHGRYAELRAFIDAALTADAGLSLDSLRLQRATGAGGGVDAELQWSLHQHGDSTDAGPP